MNQLRTVWAQKLPSSYKIKSEEQGKIDYIKYDTIDYINNDRITKDAVVYLPFGYDENE